MEPQSPRVPEPIPLAKPHLARQERLIRRRNPRNSGDDSSGSFNEMDSIDLDTDCSPIWVVRYPSTFDVAMYRDYLRRYAEACKAGERYGLILDMTQFNPFFGDAKAREASAEELKLNMAFYEETIVCEARVVLNPVVRGMLTVFDWKANMQWSVKNFRSGEVAENWVRQQMANAGVEVPSKPAWPETH